MSDNALFRELCKPEILRIGWHLAQSDSRDDFVADPVGHEDLGAHLADRLAYLLREITQERHRPRFLIHVDVPKSGLAVRPGSVLPMEEAALLHAITYLIAPRLDRHLSPSVYSYRLQKDWAKRVKKGRSMFREGDSEIPFLRGKTLRKIDPMEPWYLAWPEFDRERIALVKEKGYSHLTRTDISAYFENIDLGVVEAQLRALLPREPLVIALMMRILRAWARSTSTGIPIGRGIPQGNEVSSFLGNLYLLPLDNALNSFCRKHNAEWLRYVDDVEVYSKSERTAREVVLVINDNLRRLWLNLQGSKTEILRDAELEHELSSGALEAVDAAHKTLDRVDLATVDGKAVKRQVLKNVRPLVAVYRKKLPLSAQHLDKKNGRLLRRLFTIYGRLGRADLKRIALSVLQEPPELRMLQKALRYLEQLPPKQHDFVVDELLALLDGEVPLFSFHTAAILDCLSRLHPSQARLNISKRITTLALKQRSDWHVRQKALQLLATLPSRAPTALTRGLNSLNHHHPFVRRAGMVMLSRAHVAEFRERIETSVSDPDSAVSLLALSWQRLIQDKSAGIKEVGRYVKHRVTDRDFLWSLNKLWVLHASIHPEVVVGVRAVLDQYGASRSAKVQWHVRQLRKRTAWAAKPHDTQAGKS